MLLQAMLAFLVLLTPFGSVVDLVSGWFVKLLAFTDAGSAFLFGDLLDASKYGFAFKVLPTIIFVSALTSALYYLGVLQWVVFGFAWLMKRAMRLSGAESLAAAANVFVGQTEAPLVVKPCVARMTRSEIMSLLTGGYASISALRSGQIRKLADSGDIQPELFDQRDLAEITSEEHFPGEWLVVYFNPALAAERARKRTELLAATEGKLRTIAEACKRDRAPFHGKDKIARRVERECAKY